MCQFGWATGHPGYTLFLRMFPHETGILTSRLSKVDGPPECGWAAPNLLRAWIEQQQNNGIEDSLFFLPAYGPWDVNPLLPLGWHLYHWLPWFSSSSSDCDNTSSFPGCPACTWQTVGPLSLHIHIYIFLSCWRTLTDTTSLQQVICNEMNPVWTNGQSNSNSKYVHCIIYIKSNSTSITTLTLFQLTKAPLPEISFWITCSFLHINTDYSRISLEHICNSQWWQKRCPLPVQ